MATGIQKEPMTVKAEGMMAYVLDHGKEGNPTDHSGQILLHN